MDIVWLGFYVGCYWPIDFESISRLVCHNLTALFVALSKYIACVGF